MYDLNKEKKAATGAPGRKGTTGKAAGKELAKGALTSYGGDDSGNVREYLLARKRGGQCEAQGRFISGGGEKKGI